MYPGITGFNKNSTSNGHGYLKTVEIPGSEQVCLAGWFYFLILPVPVVMCESTVWNRLCPCESTVGKYQSGSGHSLLHPRYCYLTERWVALIILFPSLGAQVIFEAPSCVLSCSQTCSTVGERRSAETRKLT
jgi:hypothetical protein